MSEANTDGAAAPGGPRAGKFVEGSILRHIVAMSAAGGVGLIALFIGDLATIQFLSQGGRIEPVAAVSFASSILFVSISVGIGLSIAAGAVISRAIGAREERVARRLAASSFLLTAVASTVLNGLLWIYAHDLLALLGASGETLSLATAYLHIVVPFQTPLMLGMTSTGVLRAEGDARSAMNITVVSAVVTLALDVVLILWLGFATIGAAWAAVAGRLAMMIVGLWLVFGRGRKIEWPRTVEARTDMAALVIIAIPAVLTNIATPIASIYVTSAISSFGDEAIAAWGIISRLVPVAFGAIFALSGSVGPIVGQNYGANRIDRVEQTLWSALQVTAVICAVAWLLLWMSTDLIIAGFRARGLTADLVSIFNIWLAPLWLFMGMLFVANAFFNTLRRPHWATMLNWGRATIGTVPFVMIGAHFAGAKGVLIGNTIGQTAFGLMAVWLCRRLIRDLQPMAPPVPPDTVATAMR